MLTSVVSGIRNVRQYRELENARVLVTGVTAETGVDIARAFAEVGGRMVVQMAPGADVGEEERNAAVLQMLAGSATEIRATEQALDTSDAAIRLAQGASQAFGGLDAVVNIIVPDLGRVRRSMSVDEIEDAVSDALRAACLITRIAANRMSLTWTEGLVLNAVLAPAARNEAEEVYLGMLGQALAAMTRVEAGTWASKGIRVNAIGPRDDIAAGPGGRRHSSGLAGEADVAALALHLASKRGQSLSGYVFDAAGVAERRC